jgi:hypothetical protein
MKLDEAQNLQDIVDVFSIKHNGSELIVRSEQELIDNLTPVLESAEKGEVYEVSKKQMTLSDLLNMPEFESF